MRDLPQKLRELFRATFLAARLVAGRRFYLVAVWPLCWPAFLALLVVTGAAEEAYTDVSAQGTLIGFPMAVLAIFLGVRVIAGEIDSRRLEIAYTVPGGSHRLWLTKLLAAWGILILVEILLAIVAFVFFTSYPLQALYGALQAATLYLVLAMWMGALFRSEVTGALVTLGILFVNGFFSNFGGNQFRVSPFFNALVIAREDVDPAVILGWTIQNRIGFVLMILALTALAFGRAERREKMLSG